MAEIDNLIAVWIKNNFIYIACIFVIVSMLKKNGRDLRHRWFAFLIHLFTKDKESKIEDVKKDLFKSLSSQISCDPELRKEKKIRILEIGVGTGVNFNHYPDGTHLIVIDPNPHFGQYYNDNRKKYPNINSEDIIVTTGEKMDVVPDNSVDVVVMTLVLCSVSEVAPILKEILRVLTPGGKYYFLEHIREFNGEKHSWRQGIQDILSKSKLWPFLFDGCCLNRDMLESIEKAGFSKVEAQKFYAPVTNVFFSLIKPQLKGIAEK